LRQSKLGVKFEELGTKESMEKEYLKIVRPVAVKETLHTKMPSISPERKSNEGKVKSSGVPWTI